MADTFDVIVIGAGPPGENAAGRAADAGFSVAIVPSFPTLSEIWLRLLEEYGL